MLLRSSRNPQSQIAFLKNVPLFADLMEEELAALVCDFVFRKYGKGEIIFRQGDCSRELYIVVSGKVRIFKTSPSGDETSINIFSSRDIIGEFAERVDIERFNAAIISEVRGVLDDIAKETGGRAQKLEHSGTLESKLIILPPKDEQ